MDIYKILSAIGIIILHILQIVIPFIPGHFVPMTAGYIFGVWGILVDGIGMLTGSLIAYYIGRRYGKRIALKFVDEDKFERFSNTFRRKGFLGFAILFVIPFSPKDTLCFVAGALKMKVLEFVLIVLFIRIPSDAVLVLLGAGFRNVDKSLVLKLAILGLIVLTVYYIISRVWEWKRNSLK